MYDRIKILAVGMCKVGQKEKFERHSHPFCQNDIIMSGDILFGIDGVFHEVKKGDTVFVPMNKAHSIISFNGEDGYYFEIKFTVRSQHDMEMCDHIPLVVSNDEYSPVLAKAIAEEEEQDTAQRDEVEVAHLYSILYKLSADYRRKSSAQSKYIKVDSCSETIQGAVRFLENHYWERLTIYDVAKGCGMGKSSLCSKFMQETGTTVFECLMIIRIRKAVELLTFTDMTLEQISKATGFVSLTHFNRVFSQYVMIPPGQYRTHLASRETYWKNVSKDEKVGPIAIAVLERGKVDLGMAVAQV